AISGVFDLGALRDSPHVNDKVKLCEEEIQKLSPMRRPIVNKPLGIAYGTGELPAMIASSRDYHAYWSQGHVPGDLIPIANTNHFTIRRGFGAPSLLRGSPGASSWLALQGDGSHWHGGGPEPGTWFKLSEGRFMVQLVGRKACTCSI